MVKSSRYELWYVCGGSTINSCGPPEKGNTTAPSSTEPKRKRHSEEFKLDENHLLVVYHPRSRVCWLTLVIASDLIIFYFVRALIQFNRTPCEGRSSPLYIHYWIILVVVVERLLPVFFSSATLILYQNCLQGLIRMIGVTISVQEGSRYGVSASTGRTQRCDLCVCEPVSAEVGG